MEDSSSNPLQPQLTDASPTPEPTTASPDNAEAPGHARRPTSPLTEEELAAFRAMLASKREAMQEAHERFERAKVVSQAALAFEVSLVL